MLASSSVRGPGEADVLGVFAISDFKEGTVLYTESTVLVASCTNPLLKHDSNPICEYCCTSIQSNKRNEVARCDHCPATFCNDDCHTLACDTYHKLTCSKDFSWLYDVDNRGKPAKGKAPNKEIAVEGALCLRVLAICVQAGCHPLEHGLIMRLTPQYEGSYPHDWSLSRDIDRMHRLLKQLGIDIFSDLRYDTWVLQSVWARIVNNSDRILLGDQLIRRIGGLWSF